MQMIHWRTHLIRCFRLEHQCTVVRVMTHESQRQACIQCPENVPSASPPAGTQVRRRCAREFSGRLITEGGRIGKR